MGEAKRRAANSPGHKHPGSRSWAIGTIDVIANGVPYFSWRGTRHEAAALQKRYLDIVDTLGLRARSYALRAAGYLMAYGMPKKGDVDRRPSNHGGRWARQGHRNRRSCGWRSASTSRIPARRSRMSSPASPWLSCSRGTRTASSNTPRANYAAKVLIVSNSIAFR
jgi:hypothetical protein